MDTEDMKLSDNNRCFGCGKENPLGLKIALHWTGEIRQ